VTAIGFGSLVEPDHARPFHAVVPHIILRRVSLRGKETRTNRGLLFEIGTQVWNEILRKTFHRWYFGP
jgi:hypothetical protein